MIVFKAKVTDIRRENERKHISGVGGEASFDVKPLNYLVTLDGLYSIDVGPDQPKLSVGQRVRLTLEPEA